MLATSVGSLPLLTAKMAMLTNFATYFGCPGAANFISFPLEFNLVPTLCVGTHCLDALRLINRREAASARCRTCTGACIDKYPKPRGQLRAKHLAMLGGEGIQRGGRGGPRSKNRRGPCLVCKGYTHLYNPFRVELVFRSVTQGEPLARRPWAML